MNNIKVEFNVMPSTHLIEDIKKNALELSRQMGKGFTLKIDVVCNKEVSNCNVFIEKLRVD